MRVLKCCRQLKTVLYNTTHIKILKHFSHQTVFSASIHALKTNEHSMFVICVESGLKIY
jgi:hypothetical protein